MKAKIVSVFVLCLGLAYIGQSQDGVQTVLDGAYVREHNPTRKVIAYPNLREADVMWARRIWQVIDIRQKLNHTLYFPLDPLEGRKSLFDVIKIGLLEEESITAYSLGPTQDDDEFRYQLERAEIDTLLKPVKTRFVEDPVTGEKIPVEKEEPITGADIVGYKLKEDWIFDKQRSERYVRIIGIAPIIAKYSETGEFKGNVELFWLYYPECRYLFNNYDVFNQHNNSQQMTFDQLFQMRMFQGYVVKEDNVFDRRIDEYSKGIDALLESENIKNDLFIMEHDLWNY